MKAYLSVTGVLFALFGAWHFWIAVEHWRRPGLTFWDGGGPALIGVVAAAIAVWAFRLLRGGARSPA